MPRTARIAPGGVVFHIINRGNARLRIFGKEADYAAFLKVLSEVLKEMPGMRLLGFCLMPNHWHLVLWPSRGGELGRFMQRLTVRHVRRWHEHRQSGGTGHVYQGTYKSFPIQADEPLLIVLRYVERNPLRAGLVKRAEHWRWGSLWVSAKGDEAMRAMVSDWPVERPADWAARVNRRQSQAEEEAVRISLRRGRPFGREAWQHRIARELHLQSTFRPRGRPRKKRMQGK